MADFGKNVSLLGFVATLTLCAGFLSDSSCYKRFCPRGQPLACGSDGKWHSSACDLKVLSCFLKQWKKEHRDLSHVSDPEAARAKCGKPNYSKFCRMCKSIGPWICASNNQWYNGWCIIKFQNCVRKFKNLKPLTKGGTCKKGKSKFNFGSRRGFPLRGHRRF